LNVVKWLGGSNEDKFVLVEVKHGNAAGARILEEIELTRVLFEVYEGAVVRIIVELLSPY